MKGDNEIFIVIGSGKLTLDHNDIPKEDFEKEPKFIIDTKMATGLKRDELVINLMADPQTTCGEMADIETAMRRLNVRRVNYIDGK